MAGTNLGTAYVQIMPSAQGIQGSITRVLGGEASKAGEAAGTQIVGKIKGLIAAAGIGELLKEVLTAGGDLQQSFGGLDTIYGDAAEAAKRFAIEASQAGISANDYAEQAVSFGAALTKAYGGDSQSAMEAANKAIMDMADNAAKMGTPIESIQTAYQGFARGQYQLLDNLKLGYGGTKEEMERLLADATEISGIEYNIDNLGDVYNAIHVIQEDLGLTGVAAQEAQTTLTGSFSAMQAAATNFMASLSLGEGVGPALTTLIDSVSTFLVGNLFPMLGNIIMSIPEVLSAAVTAIGPQIIDAVDMVPGILDSITEQLPDLLDKGVELITNLANGVGEGLPDFISKAGELMTTLFEFLLENGPTILQHGVDLVVNLASGLVESIPDAVDAMQDVFADMLNALIDHLPDMVDAGVDIINSIGEGIQSLIQDLPDMLTEIAKNGIENFKSVEWVELGKSVISFIVEGLTAIQQNVYDIILTVGDTAYQKFHDIDWKGLGQAAIEFVVNGIINVQEDISNLVEEIGQKAYDLFHGIDWAGLGTAVIDFIVGGLNDFFDSIGNTLESIGQTALDKFLGIDWLGLGSGIVNGIIDGIWSGADGLWNTMTSLASSALDTALGWLGIGSPSKVFRDEVGKWIPLGIAAGIDEEADAVAGAVVGMAEDSVNAFDTSALRMGISAEGAEMAYMGSAVQGISINVYPSEGMDEVRLANKISDVLTLQLQQARSAWGGV